MLAPTGSGKTLAAFLWALDGLFQERPDPSAAPGFRVVYVSPLKALAADIERNLRAPLAGIERLSAAGGQPVRALKVDIRTGDTSQQARRAMLKRPGDLLITTPESLFLMLSSGARELLRPVRALIIDEVHAVAGTKRGVHLALSMERLSAQATVEPQRIGLSATQRPLSEIAAWLGGDRPVEIVDASEPPRMDLQVVVPVADMESPVIALVAPQVPARPGQSAGVPPPHPMSSPGMDKAGIWPAIHPRILALVQQHRSTIVFTNSRRLCERVAQRLNELAVEGGGDPLARAHHGSISHHQRAEIEEGLKSGRLPCIVATSSLELGIDMGAVDLVILVESPPSVASGLQRVGRAGHHVGGLSRARIFPKFRADLLLSAVVVDRMRAGAVETTRIPENPLDVLAQHIVSMCVTAERDLSEVRALVRRARPYRDLPDRLLVAVLDMLAGRAPAFDSVEAGAGAIADLERLREIKPRITWDRATDRLRARGDAKVVLYSSAGTIPDRGTFPVYHGGSGARVGELDEEMVFESRKGDTLLLGASTWRIQEIGRDRVTVEPAPGEPGRMPFWRGEGPGRPVELGRALGAFVREVGGSPEPKARARLEGELGLDPFAAMNLLALLREQKEATGGLPTDRQIVVERFRDELGDWRVCLLSPFGARVHAPWALAIQARLGAGSDHKVDLLWTDDGIVLRLPDEAELGGLSPAAMLELLFPDPEEVEELVISELRGSAAFAARFREAAVRALVLPRKRPGQRSPLWAQRLKAQELLAATASWPDFPVALEAYRECLQDHFDLPGLVEILGRIRSREIRVLEVETPTASPFARALVFAYVATWLYEGDAPLAERRAQALSIDRSLLRELLGQEELRELLDPEVVAEVEDELQHRVAHRFARGPDGLHDLLRWVGDLEEAEIASRCEGDPADWLRSLALEGRALPVRVAGRARWIAVEDLARFRDGLGVVPPPGVPHAWLAPDPRPLQALLLRYARTHGPFTTEEAADRFGLVPAQAALVLEALLAAGLVLEGAFRPGGRPGVAEWCEPEVLRRLKRRTLARLRGQVAPVDPPALARFLLSWQRVGRVGRVGPGQSGPRALLDCLVQLEGLALPFQEWEGRVLPSRLAGFEPRLLDELGASGELVWVGRGALGPRDGRVVLLRRELVTRLLDPPAVPEDLGPLHRSLLDHLERRGASFTTELLKVAEATSAEVEATLWDLVWAGLLTNDTLHPLRALAGRGASARAGRGRRTTGGRWSLVRHLFDDPPPETMRAHARATMLIERYGVVGRAVALAEELPGGFSGVYPVLAALEETGRARRGWFVDGMEGAQFAAPGAVDRLRGREAEGEGRVVVLAAMDPANPYGALLSWPESSAGRPPRRASGAVVVLVDGAPVLHLEAGSKSLLTWSFAGEEDPLPRAIEALRLDRRRRHQRAMRVERVDGLPAVEAPAALRLVAAGLVRELGRLVLEVPL